MVSAFDNSISKPTILPDFGGVPTSLALGVLGMPGWVDNFKWEFKLYTASESDIKINFNEIDTRIFHHSITALYGLIDLTQPKAGETLVVSGAAGAVGSIVGQLGKILGKLNKFTQ